MPNMGGPIRARDERAIRHKIAIAITEADDLLREIQAADLYPGVGRVCALLAEWRVESE